MLRLPYDVAADLISVLAASAATLVDPTSDPEIRRQYAAQCTAMASMLDELFGRSVASDVETEARGPYDQDEEGET